jgi:hypothetical protein
MRDVAVPGMTLGVPIVLQTRQRTSTQSRDCNCSGTLRSREYICEEAACHDVGLFERISRLNRYQSAWPGKPLRTTGGKQSLRMKRLLEGHASCPTQQDCRRSRLHGAGCDDVADWSKSDSQTTEKESIGPAGSERSSRNSACLRQPRDD